MDRPLCTTELNQRIRLSLLLGMAGLVLSGVISVLLVDFTALNLFYSGIPLQDRAGLLLFAGVVTLAVHYMIRHYHPIFLASKCSERPTLLRWGVASAVIFMLLVVLRPRLNWGDSDWVVVMLKYDMPYNRRWLTSIHILNGLYAPFRAHIAVKTFLTLLLCGLGTAEVMLMRSTVWRLFEVRDRIYTLFLCCFSYATFTLLSGYFEVYAVAHVGIVSCIAVAAALLHGSPRPLSGFVYGFIVSFSALLYMGNMPLFFIMIIPFACSVSRLEKGRWVAVFLYVLGSFVALWVSVSIISHSWLPFSNLLRAVQVFLTPLAEWRTQGGNHSWYMPVAEMLNLQHIGMAMNAWQVYNFLLPCFLLLCALALVILCLSQKRLDPLRDPVLLTIMGISGMYLFFSFTKRYVMGFKDWDLFAYSWYPVGLTGAYLYTKYVRGRTACLLPAIASMTLFWSIFTYAIMNPLNNKKVLLPDYHRQGTVENFDFLADIRMDAHMHIIRKQLYGIGSMYMDQEIAAGLRLASPDSDGGE